jgi:hypothetical protein
MPQDVHLDAVDFVNHVRGQVGVAATAEDLAILDRQSSEKAESRFQGVHRVAPCLVICAWRFVFAVFCAESEEIFSILVALAIKNDKS